METFKHLLLSDIRHRPPASSTSSLPLLTIPDSGPPPAKQGDTLGTDDNALSPLQTTTRQTGSRVMLMRLADTHARWSPRPPLDKAPRWTRPRWTRPPLDKAPLDKAPRWTRPPAGQGPLLDKAPAGQGPGESARKSPHRRPALSHLRGNRSRPEMHSLRQVLLTVVFLLFCQTEMFM